MVVYSYIPSIQKMKHEFKANLSQAANSKSACEMKDMNEESKKKKGKEKKEEENKILSKVFKNKNLLSFMR